MLRCGFILLCGLLMCSMASADAFAQKNAGKNGSGSNRDDMGEVTPEREAAALKFVELHHKALLRILESLQRVDEAQYEKAIEQIFRASERLARLKSRTPERYEFELKLWKVRSRQNLLIASLPMVSDYERAMREIEKAIAEELSIQKQLLQYEASMARKRLSRVEDSLERHDAEFDENVDRQVQRIRKMYPPAAADDGRSSKQRAK